MSAAVRLGVQQRVLPAYRVGFFDALAEVSQGGLDIFAGRPQEHEALGAEGRPQTAGFTLARNVYLGKMPGCLFWQSNLIAWLNDWQPQALILEANPRNISLPLAAAWMRRRSRPVIGWGLGAPGAQSSLAQRQIYRRFLPMFDTLIAYSHRGAEQYAAAGFDPARIVVAHNAVARRPASPPPMRDSLSPNHPAVIMFVGRLQARKRIDLLLDACSKLSLECQPELWIVGDGPARADLEAISHAVYPAAQFFGDRRGEDLAQLFARADLFVLPGTGGLAVQQAMAAGLPVIVARGDGTQEDLVRPQNGWLIPADDPDALHAALQQALSNPDRLRKMGQASYRIVTEEINLEQMVAAFERALALAGQPEMGA